MRFPKKQKALLEKLPSDVEFSTVVRFNSAPQYTKFLKMKAFEGSGVLWVAGDVVYFKSTKGLLISFDLKNYQILWKGENLVNGLLKWFSIGDEMKKIYFNVESGMFIFNKGPQNLTTRSIFEKLLLKQAATK